MTMVKQLTLFIFVLISLSSGLTLLKAQNTLYVKERTGTQTAYPLSGIRKLNFSADTVKITKTGGETQNYTLGDVRFFSFKNYFLGIPDPGSDQKDALRLYPNPVNNILHIEYTGKQSKEVTIEILDLQGRVLQSCSFQNRKAIMDISNLNVGIYICRLYGNSEVIVRKFIKN